MKRLSGSVDFVCTTSKPADIATYLNKIHAMYDLEVVAMCDAGNGKTTIVVKRMARDVNGPTSVLKSTGSILV